MLGILTHTSVGEGERESNCLIGSNNPIRYAAVKIDLAAYFVIVGAPHVLHFHITHMTHSTHITHTQRCILSSRSATNSTMDDYCPSLANAGTLQYTELIQRMTHVCRYDRLERPIGKSKECTNSSQFPS